MSRVFEIFQTALDFIFKLRCASCGKRIEPGHQCVTDRVFCNICSEALVKHDGAMCVRCGQPYETARNDHMCPSCIRKAPPFEKIYSPYIYGGPLAEAISRMKYSPEPHLANGLGAMLVEGMEDMNVNGPFDFTVPVPLHPARLARRGFNQSALLAVRVAKKAGAGLKTGVLRRRGVVSPQVGKDRRHRLTNPEDSFYIAAKGDVFTNCNILVVDDVVTTAATARAVSKVLKKDGAASRVTVLSLARAE